MAKFPAAPTLATLTAISPSLRRLPAGTVLARIYCAGGEHPVAWNQFRQFGPGAARFDHHLADADGNPQQQDRAILYAAVAARTCIAEFFQAHRIINKHRHAPWLTVFALAADLNLLDLSGNFVTRIGASTALHSGPRARARQWAQVLYQAYPQGAGIVYAASMDGNAPALALWERAQPAMPKTPLFNRALSDATLTDLIDASAEELGYRLC